MIDTAIPRKRKAYHSQFISPSQVIGNMALLPLCTNFKGPAPKEISGNTDIIEEALYFFKANIFFRNYEIKSAADRTLIYLTLYIVECLKRLQKCANKTAGLKEMTNLALNQSIPIPGEQDLMRAYLLQMRQEMGVRICDKVFDVQTLKPSKWWICFSKRRFMEKTLLPLGA
uniref:Actin-related protein 2/3 complex subunit 3 n=1 Tax=Romanomermis culicivorax TaxID=13658 RepID=A0A915KW48_ROMCU